MGLTPTWLGRPVQCQHGPRQPWPPRPAVTNYLFNDYLQVLLPVLPLQLPEQQSPLLVQLAPDGLQEGPPFGSSHCATLG